MSEPDKDNNTMKRNVQRETSDTESNEDAASLRTLKGELSGYMGRTESSLYLEVYPGTERAEYDFTIERTHLYSTNLVESTSHLIKGCIGAGILAMHEAYMRGGIWASLQVTVVIGAIVSYSMNSLVSSAHKLYVRLRVPRLSYPDLVEAAFATGPLKGFRKMSKIFRHFIEILIFTEMCGTCCLFQIMIAHTVKQALEAVSVSAERWNLSIPNYILIFMVPLLLVSMIRSPKYLAQFSLVADCSIGVCVIVMIFYSFGVAGNLGDIPGFKSFYGLLQFSGILLYSIDGIGVVMPIENFMQKPRYFLTVLQFGMSLVILSVTLTGFFGYWGYGEHCRSPITLQLPRETIPILIQFLLVLVLGVSYAVNIWVPFRVIWHYLIRKHRQNRCKWERIYRGILVILITVITVLYPNLIRFIVFLGNFFSSFTVLIFPAIVDILVNWKNPGPKKIRWRSVLDVFIILAGSMLVVGAFYTMG